MTDAIRILRTNPRLRATACCLAALLCLRAGAAAADESCWRELRYVASNGWIGASSTLRYDAPVPAANVRLAAPAKGTALLPSGQQVARIRASLQAMRSTGELETWYDPQTLAVLQSRRVSHGKNSRLKTLRFLGTGVWRERFEPAAGSDPADPARWQRGHANLIPYPAAATTPVLTPIMLLGRATAMVRSGEKAQEHLVFTDTQLYRVRLIAAGPEPVDVDFSLAETTHGRSGPADSIRGARKAQRIAVLPQLLGSSPEDEPFSLLELTGELAIFVDVDSGLPLRIEGSWLRLGTVPAELVQANVVAGCSR